MSRQRTIALLQDRVFREQAMRWLASAHDVFALGGIRMRADLSVLLPLPLAWLYYGDALKAGLAFLCYLMVLAVHAAGHLIAASFLDLKVSSLRACAVDVTCGHDPSRRGGENAAVAFAGAAMLALLLIAAMIGKHVYVSVITVSDRVFGDWHHIVPVFDVFITLNAALMVVALLPVRGLDGAVAWPSLRRPAR